MRKVVDTNFLRRPELDVYLSTSPTNIAVVTEFSAIESYDGSAESLLSSMAILSRFPSQVLVLKNIVAALQTPSTESGGAAPLINQEFSNGFPRFANDVQQSLKQGLSADDLAVLKSRSADARSIRDVALEIAKSSPEMIKNIAARFDKQQRKALLAGPRYPDEVAKNLIVQAVESVNFLLAHLPLPPARPTTTELPYSFIFRYSLTSVLSAATWVADGSPSNVNAENYRNDFADASIVAFATYFDGMLSEDRRANRILSHVNGLLGQIPDL